MSTRRRNRQGTASFLSCTLPLIFVMGIAYGQIARNPKLSATDLDSAQTATREAGGAEAQLVYAIRIDAVAKGSFDSLVVIYSKAGEPAKEYYGIVLREGRQFPLVGGKRGMAFPMGDRFLRIGLRHEAGAAPTLRLMSATTESGQPEERQRNLDFQFNGTEFALTGQSISSVAR